MSKVLDKLKSVDESLPQSDQGLNFPGKGFLTALVDTSGSELKRQRDLEDSLKHQMAAPLIQKYWTGDLTDEEREAVADQIKTTIGGGKRTKAFLDKMFEVGGQVHGVKKMLPPPPGAASQVATSALQQASQDAAEGASGTTDTAAPATPAAPVTAPAGPLAPPPTATAGPAGPAPTPGPAPAIEGPTLPPPPTAQPRVPLSSALSKMFPTGMTDKEKMELAHTQKMEELRQTADAQMDQLKESIEAGRYDKPLTKIIGREVIDGKMKTVAHWYDKNGQEDHTTVTGDAPMTWASKPRPIWAMDEQGKIYTEIVDPMTGQRVPGTDRRYDIIPPAAFLPKISQREAVFVDEDNVVHTEPLTTIRSVQLPGAAAPSSTVAPVAPSPGPSAALPGGAGGGAPAGGTGAGASPGARPGAANVSPAPTVAPLQSRVVPGLFPPSVVSKSIERATPIREAYTSMIGTPDMPDAPSFMKYAKIADDPVRRAKLGKALELTFGDIEQDEKAHGSLVNLFKLYAGVPAAEINARLATYSDIIGEGLKDDPELQQAYNATMTLFGNAMALRSLTKVGVAQANMKAIEREIPFFDKNTFNSKDVAGKLYGLLRTAHNGMKGVPTITNKERAYVEQKLEDLNRLNAGSTVSPPPTGVAADFPVTFKGAVFHFKTKAQADKFKADQGIK